MSRLGVRVRVRVEVRVRIRVNVSHCPATAPLTVKIACIIDNQETTRAWVKL